MTASKWAQWRAKASWWPRRIKHAPLRWLCNRSDAVATLTMHLSIAAYNGKMTRVWREPGRVRWNCWLPPHYWYSSAWTPWGAFIGAARMYLNDEGDAA